MREKKDGKKTFRRGRILGKYSQKRGYASKIASHKKS
jgi:hypothetical protein